MTTYTLAIGADMLLATVPDGCDIHAAAREMMRQAGVNIPAYDIIRGCTLTDTDFDGDHHDYVWKSGNSGWLMDETGADWRYAVKP